MSSASFFVSPHELWSRIGTADAPMILDVRRREIYEAASGRDSDGRSGVSRKPTPEWVRQPARRPADRARVPLRAQSEPDDRRGAARSAAMSAQVLEGGYQAWSEAGLPLVTKATLERFAPKRRACG